MTLFGNIEARLSSNVIDDFEHNNLTGIYTGDTGGFDIQSTTQYEQTYALAGTSAATRDDLVSFSGDGLSNYIDQGDTFQFKVMADDKTASARMGIGYGIQSGNTGVDQGGYNPTLYADTDSVRLLKWDNGSSTTILELTNFTYTAGEWWTLEIQWATDDTHYVTLYDNTGTQVDTGSISDTLYSGNNGTVGWLHYTASGPTTYADLAELV